MVIKLRGFVTIFVEGLADTLRKLAPPPSQDTPLNRWVREEGDALRSLSAFFQGIRFDRLPGGAPQNTLNVLKIPFSEALPCWS
jgi:hypothetical protein